MYSKNNLWQTDSDKDQIAFHSFHTTTTVISGQLEKQGTGSGNGNGNGKRERERTTDGAQNGIDLM